MLSAVNSKNRRYEPRKWMLKTNIRGMQDEPAERQAMTGDQVWEAMKRRGFPMIDMRQVTQ